MGVEFRVLSEGLLVCYFMLKIEKVIVVKKFVDLCITYGLLMLLNYLYTNVTKLPLYLASSWGLSSTREGGFHLCPKCCHTAAVAFLRDQLCPPYVFSDFPFWGEAVMWVSIMVTSKQLCLFFGKLHCLLKVNFHSIFNHIDSGAGQSTYVPAIFHFFIYNKLAKISKKTKTKTNLFHIVIMEYCV